MAEQMIRFYGFEPEEDIKIEYIGKRPGERIDEALWGKDETPVPTEHNRILKVERNEREAASPPLADLDELTRALRPVCKFDREKPEQYRDSALLREILHAAIPSLIMPPKPAPVVPASPVHASRRQAKPAEVKIGGGYGK
jgi:FlaA1/EpsC-like NDP-sugar epimerase